jgi:hypothetical protein
MGPAALAGTAAVTAAVATGNSDTDSPCPSRKRTDCNGRHERSGDLHECRCKTGHSYRWHGGFTVFVVVIVIVVV